MPDCGSFSSKRDMGSMISKPRFVAPTVSTFAALPSSFAGWLGACVWCGFGCMATRGWKLNLQLTNPKRHELCLCQKARWSAAQYKIAMNSGPHHFRLNCISKWKIVPLCKVNWLEWVSVLACTVFQFVECSQLVYSKVKRKQVTQCCLRMRWTYYLSFPKNLETKSLARANLRPR